jgi:predicted nucleic acid-binding Zn ribbon protein
MKLLAGNVLQRLNEDLGAGTIEVIDVLGPHTPRWTSGRLRVKGRGPRDTYG